MTRCFDSCYAQCARFCFTSTNPSFPARLLALSCNPSNSRFQTPYDPPAPLSRPQEKLFAQLVPDSAARALSRYTDLVDGVIRDQVDRLATATDTARVKLKEWELPDSLEALGLPSRAMLPAAVANEVDAVEGAGGLGHLKVSTQMLRDNIDSAWAA